MLAAAEARVPDGRVIYSRSSDAPYSYRECCRRMEGGELMILGKLLLTFGVLLGVALWQLYVLRKERLSRSDGQGRA